MRKLNPITAAITAALAVAGLLASAVAAVRTWTDRLLMWGGMHVALLNAGIANAGQRDLATILGEMKKLQDEYTGKPMPEDVGKKFDELAAEGKSLQDEADRKKRIEGLEIFGREVADPALPGGKAIDQDIGGYMTLGRAFIESEQFKTFINNGMPQHGSLPFKAKSAWGADRFIPVEKKRFAELLMEIKAVPTIGAGVIVADRISEVVRTTEMTRLTLRDLVNVSRTTSSSVEYVTITPSANPAAAPTAESAAKPETTITMGKATAPVRTLAVHMPVTEQQLQDIPQVQDTIDNEQRYELALVEERQMAWGDGTGENLLGIFNTPGVIAGRAVGGDTLLDKVRRAITDVRVAELEPNGIGVHPYDWEAIQLLKGSDSRYVWVVVTDATGAQRLWGLRAVESAAMQEPGAYTTPERRILVGDYMRGATLWDRQETQVAVGWINDQFIKNQRTIRTEERVAFGVKRPRGFRYVVAAARVA